MSSTSFQSSFPPPAPTGSSQVYPTTSTSSSTQRPSSSLSNNHYSSSNGSFGAVFIVLAVIVVVSAVACVVGRLCSGKKSKQGRSASHQPKGVKQSQALKHHGDHKHGHNNSNNIRPRERDSEFGFRSKEGFGFRSSEGDIEFGFDKRVPKGSTSHGNGDTAPRGHKAGRGQHV